jgi:hypothetical protein
LSSTEAFDSCDSTRRFSRASEQVPQSLTLTEERNARTEVEILKIELAKLRKENARLTKPNVRGASLKNEMEKFRKEHAIERDYVTEELVVVLEQLAAKEKETNDANARILILEKATGETNGVKKAPADTVARISCLETEASELQIKLSTKEAENAEAKAELSSEDKEAVDHTARLSIKEQEASAAEPMLNIQAKEIARLKSELAANDKETDNKPLEKSIPLHEQEKESLLLQITTLDCALQQLRQQHTEEVDSIKLKAAAELEKTQQNANERVEKCQAEFKKETGEMSEVEKCQANDISQEIEIAEEKELRIRVELLEAEATTKKEEYERRLQKVRKDHTVELDDLLAQLDLVEAEHKEKILEATTEKDTIIAALDAQVADANTQENDVDATHKKLTVDLARVQEEAVRAKEDFEKLKGELETSKSAHDRFMSSEVERRERACDEAREEMIERAEIQYKAANDLYVKLKKEHVSSVGNEERLEDELKSVKMKLEKANNEKEETVADLKVKIAKLEAVNARFESDAAQREKEGRREIEGLRKAARDFENKFEDAKSTSRSQKRSLSAAVAAKTKVQQELDEMKIVCEELMTMVEGQEQGTTASA